MTEAIVCHGPTYRNCHNVIDFEHAFVPSAKRIGGQGPLTKKKLLAAAICDDCKCYLEWKGIHMFPLLDSLASILAAETRAWEERPCVSLRELLVLKRSARSVVCSRQTRAARRQASQERNARLFAMAQRTTVAA
jgi:hypothetical protein